MNGLAEGARITQAVSAVVDRSNESARGRGHGLRTTTLLVVTSMIGSGVFTTSGLLLEDLPPLAVIVVWIVGGLVSLAGAWVYAELAVAVTHLILRAENDGAHGESCRFLGSGSARSGALGVLEGITVSTPGTLGATAHPTS